MSAPIAERLAAQGLLDRAAGRVEDVVGSLLAIQAQDPRGARLAIRARTTGLTATDVDAALTDERSLLVSWLNRGTLHLVRAEDYAWLHALTTPQLRAGNARRLDQEGVSEAQASRGVALVRDAVRDDGPQTRGALRDLLEHAGVPTSGQALVHLLVRATIEGLIVRGPLVAGEQAFVGVEQWLGSQPTVDRGAALAELAGRYLVAHGPAADVDLARWAGITLGDARRGLAAIASRLAQRPGGLVALASAPRVERLPAPRLLGPFDPILHGWASREAFVGSHAGVVTTNGVFRATALAGGKVVATWSLAAGRVVLRPLEPIEQIAGELAVEAADVQRFIAPGRAST
jgi:hypothetical protein